MNVPTMTSGVLSSSTEGDEADKPRAVKARRARLMTGLALAGLLAAAALGAGATELLTASRKAAGTTIDNAYPISTATVVRRALSSQTSVDATLGYGGNYDVINQAEGTITMLPTPGQVVRQGQVLYRVDQNPVVLLYGATPMYRSLAEGASASDVVGPDVAELNADLVALGYADHAEIPAGSDNFSWWTKQAVEKLQAALGVLDNGRLDPGQVIFVPSAARVTSLMGNLGGQVGPGQLVMSASSTTREVTINLDAAQQSEVQVGDKVSITMPSGRTTPGVVASVGTVAAAPAGGGPGASPTVTVEVRPTDPAATGNLDQAPAQVSITTSTVSEALVVPVTALVSLSSGGYAVEVVGLRGIHHLVSVTLGIFDDADGLVQVSGPGLVAGQRVVVPSA